MLARSESYRQRLHREHLERVARLTARAVAYEEVSKPATRTPLPPTEAVRRRHPSFDLIKRVICAHYHISHAELIGIGREHRVMLPRQVAMYVMRETIGGRAASFPRIGEMLGNRDHTSVMHGCQAMRALAKRDAAVAQILRDLVCCCKQLTGVLTRHGREFQD
jgi:chromosomal replication initiation ATPase DnaA